MPCLKDHKPVVWFSAEIKSPPFSQSARLEAGFLIRMLQAGERLSMPQSRPMPNIGRRCYELRINDEDSTWRIIYRIDEDAVVIVHVFSKKSRTTPRAVIEVSQQRLKVYDRSVT